MKRTILLCAALALSSCVTKPPSLSDPPVPNVCPYDIVGPCFRSSASYGGTIQLSHRGSEGFRRDGEAMAVLVL